MTLAIATEDEKEHDLILSMVRDLEKTKLNSIKKNQFK